MSVERRKKINDLQKMQQKEEKNITRAINSALEEATDKLDRTRRMEPMQFRTMRGSDAPELPALLEVKDANASIVEDSDHQQYLAISFAAAEASLQGKEDVMTAPSKKARKGIDYFTKIITAAAKENGLTVIDENLGKNIARKHDLFFSNVDISGSFGQGRDPFGRHTVFIKYSDDLPDNAKKFSESIGDKVNTFMTTNDVVTAPNTETNSPAQWLLRGINYGFLRGFEQSAYNTMIKKNLSSSELKTLQGLQAQQQSPDGIDPQKITPKSRKSPKQQEI